MSLVWTWPLALHFRDHIPGLGGDNYSLLWNLWWMRKALASPELEFFHSNFLFNPFGVDLITHPHTALQSYVSATALAAVTLIEVENLYIIVSVFLNTLCAYALVFDIVRRRGPALLAGFAFGGSPYIAAQLMGRFDLLTAWVIPLFALLFRRALKGGRIGPAVASGACVAVAAYSAYDHVVYLAVFAVAYTLAAWRFQRPPAESLWRGIQGLMIATAVFAVLALPLIVQAFRLVASGRYVGQAHFWRGAPRGVEMLAPLIGNPFHPLYGGAASRFYEDLGIDRIEAAGWIGIVPILVLMLWRGKWLDSEEARRWKIVLTVFAVLALGPVVAVGRPMVVVYLALGVLMGLRLAVRTPGYIWIFTALLALDYLHAPIPLTALDRPAVYQQLGSINDSGAVIEVPFGIGDALTRGIGNQNRRLLYYATIHGHPVVGGYIGRMPPLVAQAYDAMPVVGNLLRLSSGREALEENAPPALPFRYLVLDTAAATPDLVEYVGSTLDMDLIASGDGKELYAVQGVKSSTLRATR